MRYQIVYSKFGSPLTTWTDSKEKACRMAQNLRNTGYNVHVWAHTKDGSHMTNL